jgi:methionine aminopeptidase
MHMPPTIIHTKNDEGGKMEVGNVFTIEPIIMAR